MEKLATLCITTSIFWGVVIMLEAGIVDVVVVVEAAVVSPVLSFVFCWLLLHAVKDSNSATSKELEMVRANIIVVVFSVKKCRGGGSIQGVCAIKLQQS